MSRIHDLVAMYNGAHLHARLLQRFDRHIADQVDHTANVGADFLANPVECLVDLHSGSSCQGVACKLPSCISLLLVKGLFVRRIFKLRKNAFPVAMGRGCVTSA